MTAKPKSPRRRPVRKVGADIDALRRRAQPARPRRQPDVQHRETFVTAGVDIQENGVQVAVRRFDTGATRDSEIGKPDYEGFLSPLVIEAYGRYMNHHRRMADGSLRDSDNWQKGIPPEAYMKSGWRHFMEWWKCHRGGVAREGIVFAVCGLLFNAMGWLHEYLKAHPELIEGAGEDGPP